MMSYDTLDSHEKIKKARNDKYVGKYNLKFKKYYLLFQAK